MIEKKFLIVGYGNTLRADDGLGPAIAERLEPHRLPPDAQVRILSLPQLDISLVTELRDADVAIFVDARQDQENALVLIDRIEPSGLSACFTHSTHSLELPALLEIHSKWYAKNTRCYLIKPKGFDFSISESISRKAEQAAFQATEMIYDIFTKACLTA